MTGLCGVQQSNVNRNANVNNVVCCVVMLRTLADVVLLVYQSLWAGILAEVTLKFILNCVFIMIVNLINSVCPKVS